MSPQGQLKTCAAILQGDELFMHRMNDCSVCFIVSVARESKTLSGKSLKCLAKEIDKTVGLGIQLSLSESALTCMAFDALASGLTMSDMTYRILLLWKRRSDPLFKGRQVDMLVSALRQLGRNDLANIVVDRHSKNLELTPECFEESNDDTRDTPRVNRPTSGNVRPSSSMLAERRSSTTTSVDGWPTIAPPHTTPVSDQQIVFEEQNPTAITRSRDSQTSPQPPLGANSDRQTVIY